MKLKIKIIDWQAGIPVSMLNEVTAEKIGARTKDRISIKVDGKEFSTIVDTVGKLIGKNEVAISSELKDILNLKNNQVVDVNLSLSPQSLDFIKKKLNGKKLSEKEIAEIVKDISLNSLSEAEIALFISAVYRFGMSLEENVSFTKAILKSGETLKFNKKIVVDKHSIGGVAGRTTPIVVSICAAAGLTFPKTSSRAITSPAGTADAIEVLAKVDFSMKDIKKIVTKTNACLVWGGGLGMVPADDKIITIEKMLKIDPEANLLSSIMSKKLAVGSNHILIHIPYGETAKVSRKKAQHLARKFKQLAKEFHVLLECVLTENEGPLGDGVGPVLEMIDVLKVLRRESKCYQLEEESLILAGEILELTGKAKKGKGRSLALNILNSGVALKKFEEIILAQGGKIKNLSPAKFKRDIFSSKKGKITLLDNKKVNSLAIISGCPADKSSGLFLYKHYADKVSKYDKLMTIYSESKSRLKEAFDYYKENNPFTIK